MATSPYIIAVSNRKGGTGKTTVSVNIAAELAALGQRVLLADLDTQGHCAVGLGVNAITGEHSIHQLFADSTARLIDTVVDTAYPNLSIAPADQLFEHGSGVRDVRLLTKALAAKEIVDRFDVVILDTPPSFDILLLNALAAANWVLVPYVPHHLSFEGVRQLMRVLFKVMSSENPGLKILGFLPMMAARHVKQHRSISEEVSRQFGAHRVLTGIRNDIRLAESFAAGKPIRYYAAKSRAAEDFAQLGDMLVKICGRDKVTKTQEN
jgi:chromosome partitioning protein